MIKHNILRWTESLPVHARQFVLFEAEWLLKTSSRSQCEKKQSRNEGECTEIMSLSRSWRGMIYVVMARLRHACVISQLRYLLNGSVPCLSQISLTCNINPANLQAAAGMALRLRLQSAAVSCDKAEPWWWTVDRGTGDLPYSAQT